MSALCITNTHSPANLLPTPGKANTAGEVFSSLPRRLPSFTWERLRAVFFDLPAAFAITRDRRAFLGTATGVGSLSFWTLMGLGSRNQRRSQSPAISSRLFGSGNASRAATSGQDEPLYSHVLAAFSRWLSPKSGRAPLSNFPKRTRLQRAYLLLVEPAKQTFSRLFVSLCVLSSLPSVHGFNHGGREIGNVRKSVGEIRNVQC